MGEGILIPAGHNPLWHHDNGGFAALYSDSEEKVDETPYRVDNLNNDSGASVGNVVINEFDISPSDNGFNVG